MGNDSLIESICRNYGLNKEVVMEQRKIPSGEAAERFLGVESRAMFSKTNPLGRGLVLIPELKDEFYQTSEGKLWYDCNVVHGQVYLDICARAYSGAQRFARNIAEGQARTRAKTNGFKFKAVG